MSKINDGGPAFPVLYGQTNGQDGMSLRDWFAATIDGLSEECAPDVGEALVGRPMPDGWIEIMAWWAEADAVYRYMRADALLAERAKGSA
jgi:hypothetical protein